MNAADRLVWIGAAWAVLGALPIAAVASIWSAYFYLFALCGAALALGGLVLRWPMWARAVSVALLVLTSSHARQLDEFTTGGGPWSSQSHINRFYLERGMATTARFLGELRAARPTLPPRSTVFFADVPPSVGFQTADGPVIRWAYRDSSLRSYYLTELSSDKLSRGPLFFFAVQNDTLRDHTDDPNMLASAAYSMILDDKPAAARPVLELIVAHSPEDHVLRYWLAWTQWAGGDTSSAAKNLRLAGTVPAVGSAPELAAAAHPLSSADTARAIAQLLGATSRAGLTPQLHARLAALCLPTSGYKQLGVIEAFAFMRLSPRNPDAWRKWASAQLAERRYGAAERSLTRYFQLGGTAAQQDLEAHVVLASLHRLTNGDAPPPER